MYLISVPFPALLFLCFCVHVSPLPLPYLWGGWLNSSYLQSNILGFLFLLFFSSAGFCKRITCLGTDDIYFLSRFGRAIIAVCVLLSLISWRKRLWLMREAYGESWSCKITSARPRWWDKGQTEGLERTQSVAWRKDKRDLDFSFLFTLESDQKDKRQL